MFPFQWAILRQYLALNAKFCPEDGSLEWKHVANYVLMTIYVLWLTKNIILSLTVLLINALFSKAIRMYQTVATSQDCTNTQIFTKFEEICHTPSPG